MYAKSLGIVFYVACYVTLCAEIQASRKAPGKAALLHSCAELELAFDKKTEALAYAKKAYKLQVHSREALMD